MPVLHAVEVVKNRGALVSLSACFHKNRENQGKGIGTVSPAGDMSPDECGFYAIVLVHL